MEKRFALRDNWHFGSVAATHVVTLLPRIRKLFRPDQPQFSRQCRIDPVEHRCGMSNEAATQNFSAVDEERRMLSRPRGPSARGSQGAWVAPSGFLRS
jgi:hypothetical protein